MIIDNPERKQIEKVDELKEQDDKKSCQRVVEDFFRTDKKTERRFDNHFESGGSRDEADNYFSSSLLSA